MFLRRRCRSLELRPLYPGYLISTAIYMSVGDAQYLRGL